MPAEPMSRLVDSLRTALEANGESDAALLNRVRTNRDPAAVETIVRRHGPKVLAACRKVLGPAIEVDDAFQATFLVLLRNPSAIRKHASLGSWLYGVAHRIALQARKRSIRREQSIAEVAANVPDLSWREACAILHEELNRLPDAMRLPLLLCYLDGLSRDEAAAQLGRTLNSVKKSLERGREVLRRRLTRRGVALTAGLLAAVGEPVSGDVSAELVQSVQTTVISPSQSVTSLAYAVVGNRLTWRTVGVGLAASALTVGIALAFQKGPNNEPPPKDFPTKPAEKNEASTVAKSNEKISFGGVVVDPDGKPVKGAKIYLLRWGELWPGPDADPLAKPVDTSVKATTDADGRFQFDVPQTDYPNRWWSDKPHLVATANGYGMGLLTVDSRGGSQATMSVPADHPIHGRIINLEGKPLRGIEIRVIVVQAAATDDLTEFIKSAQDGELDKRSIDSFFPRGVGYLGLSGSTPLALPKTSTDDQGRFELRGIGRDRLVTVSIRGPGIATERVMILTQSGPSKFVPKTALKAPKVGPTFYRSPIEFAAEPDQPYEGTVTDKVTGKPVPGVRVWLPGNEVIATTDREGKYSLRGARPSRYAVYFQPGPDVPYHGRAVFDGERGSTRAIRLDLTLTPAVWISGRVVDEQTGSPVPGANVDYRAADVNPNAIVETDPDLRMSTLVRTGLDGKFRLRGVAGRGWIQVTHAKPHVLATEREVQGESKQLEVPGILKVANDSIALNMINALAAIDVDPAKPKEHVITLDPGVAASIKLIDPNGRPLKGVIAYGIPRVDYRWTRPAESDTVQALSINPLRPRPFLFMHIERGLGGWFQPNAKEVGPWTVKLMPLSSVTGRLVGEDGKPMANASVGAFAKYPWQRDTAPAWDGPEYKVTTDSEGRFKITNVIGDADYALIAYGERVQLDRFPFKAKPGETKDLGDIKTREPRK